MAIKVFRPSSATLGRALGDEVAKNANVMLTFQNDVQIPFSTKKSDFVVIIEPDSFKAMAEYMMSANANEAIKAFGAAMAVGIERPKNSN
jgi:hypothetical protein